MKGKGVLFFLLLFLLLSVPFSVYALDAPETKTSSPPNGLTGFTQSFKANGGYLDVGMRFGYMDGFTSFDFNHRTSELEYPFNCYLGGGTINLGYKDLSLNSEFS